MRRCFAVLILWLALGCAAWAHSMMTGYLDLVENSDGTTAVTWRRPILPIPEYTVQPLFPACSQVVSRAPIRDEGTFTTARMTLRGTPPLWSGMSLGLQGHSPAAMEVLLRLQLANGQKFTAILRNANDRFTIPEHPSRWSQVASYLALGIDHILKGVDHLLVVLGLLFIVPSTRMLVKTVTAFTVAHSITLGAATLGYVSAPLLPLNAAIALSIFFLGPEIVRKERGGSSLTIRHPWIVAFAFGLLHGFGFASGLAALGLPREDVPLALLLFNIGVEIGQLGFIILILSLRRSFRVLEVRWPLWAARLPCYTVGGLGAYWTIQRTWILLTTAALQ